MRSPRPTVVVSRQGVRPGSAAAQKPRGEVLGTVRLFSTVPRRHLRKIAELTREVRYSPGSSIVRKGERGDDFFVVLEGTASIVRGSGLPAITIGPGDCFGEMSLIDGGQRSATVVARSDMVCLRLSRAPFSKMLKDEPEIAVGLLRELTRRIRELQARSNVTG